MLPLYWLHLEAYEKTLIRQEQQRKEVLSGQGKECIFAVEHHEIVTLGRRSNVEAMPKLEAYNLPTLQTQRGGLATYHGPGQLVIYPIVHLKQRNIKVRIWVEILEQCAIDILESYQIEAKRRENYPGVWVHNNKICALGLHIQHGVSIHGISINIANNLFPYTLFQPCGIVDGGVTRLNDHTAQRPNLVEIAKKYGKQLNKYLKRFDSLGLYN